MKKQVRRYEIIIGICFLVATATYAIGNQMIEGGVHQLESTASKFGVGFELINSFAVVMIGWLSFKILKSYHKKLLKGYMFSRMIEGFILAIGAISALLVSQTNIETILQFRDLCFSLAMLVLGGISIYYCRYLMKKRLAPNWMMGLGVIGYVCLCIYSLLMIISQSAPMLLFIPGGLFELIFPIFLVFKGFHHSFNFRTNN